MNEDQIDSFILELHDFLESHPLVLTEEGYDHLHEFVHQRFDKFWSYLIKDRNYN